LTKGRWRKEGERERERKEKEMNNRRGKEGARLG
jgi:hypothetical protein